MSDPRSDLIQVCGEIAAAGLVVGRAGNVSVRLSDHRVLITASGASLENLTDDKLAVVSLDGVFAGQGNPSSEYPLHEAIYAARPDVGAIVHTHSVYATVAGVLKEGFLGVNPEAVESLGVINIAPARPHGTRELAVAATRALGQNNGVLLENHGAVTVGVNLATAVENALYLEQTAKISYLIKNRGGM